MVPTAKEHAVFKVRRSAIAPERDVMSLGPGAGNVAAGEGAPLVAGGQGAALTVVEQPHRSPLVQDGVFGAEQQWDQIAIAGQHANGAEAHRSAVVEDSDLDEGVAAGGGGSAH